MASRIRQEMIDRFKSILSKYEPYPIDFYMNLPLDADGYENDPRCAATTSLIALLEMGFSEDEVNPWKNKETV